MSETQSALECLDSLRIDIEDRKWISYGEFLELVRSEPQRVLRNVFQLFRDMVQSAVGKGEDEYPDDPESIGYIRYDCSKLFATDTDNPFFADRLFANRFVRQISAFGHGSQQNRVHVYLGPPGCGKSTFLNNLLQRFEEYTSSREGQTFEIFWDIEGERDHFCVPCPSHDHPILIIPKKHRSDVLNRLLALQSSEVRHIIGQEKEYSWLFEGEVCTICRSIFEILCSKFGSLEKVLAMMRVMPYHFNRRIGEGISVFNPGDRPLKESYSTDRQLQAQLDKMFGPGQIKYAFSQLARTNNGIYVLMDIKGENEARLVELHNVISEGVHRVGDIEEQINALFLALMNPEDEEAVKAKKMESFQARISYNRISYVMEVATEVRIYRSIFGERVDCYFLPRVMENFARVIISSRMNQECKPLKEWISDVSQYSKRHFCDPDGFLLRMEVYGGIIPPWLSEEDKKKFTAERRRALIDAASDEGRGGFSGRDAIKYFGELIGLYGPKTNEPARRLISMTNVTEFFKHKIGREIRDGKIPKNFIAALMDWYDFAVLNEVKESLYFYNQEQIQRDILHYLFAINYDPDGQKLRCPDTGREVEITIGFLELMASAIAGETVNKERALVMARDNQKRYVGTIARNPRLIITESELYGELLAAYSRNLKEKVLEPFLGNDNFREAVKAFGSKLFGAFDTRLKEHITHMISNLVNKFGYTEQGAKEICLYVMDQKLTEKFK